MLKEIVVASNNQGKVKEIDSLLNNLNIKVVSLKDVFDKEVAIEETGSTFEENAIIKAEAVSRMVHKIVIADDSGLEIDALNKEPGVQSARYLGYDTPYTIKNSYLLELLKGQTQRSARYVCAMALAIPNQKTIVFKETMEGEIAYKSAGENGFGYDPIFYFPELAMTAAQMTLEEKNIYSHRAKALKKVVEIIKEMK